jgi:HAD superfamily hydrolase (TIGR01662 family)
VFDRDQTLVTSTNPNSKFCTGFEFELMPNRWGAIHELNKRHRLAIASNQGGVAAGHKTIKHLYLEAGFLNGLIGFPLLQLYCPCLESRAENELVIIDGCGHTQHIPSAFHRYRKPRPGMLLKAKELIAPEAQFALFVGDRDEDEDAAARAGWSFCWANDFPWGDLDTDNQGIPF